MTTDNETPDLSGLIAGEPPETPEQARARIIGQVMASQQALSQQFSRIDHPFVTEDAQDDYELARHEFEALIKCSVHMPESVEGVRFLGAWHANRMAQIELLLENAKGGNQMVFGAGAEPVVITEDFAKGMRATLLVVRSLFEKFPLQLTVSTDPDD